MASGNAIFRKVIEHLQRGGIALGVMTDSKPLEYTIANDTFALCVMIPSSVGGFHQMRMLVKRAPDNQRYGVKLVCNGKDIVEILEDDTNQIAVTFLGVPDFYIPEV